MKTNHFLRNFIAITRLRKPIGSLLLLVPCLIAVFYNIYIPYFTVSDFKVIILLIIGSFLMRSAGCIVNDFFDAKFDQQVARTKNRPLASGAMSKFQALTSLLVLLILSLLILIQFHLYAIICGFLSLILIFLYPLMKRVTFFPQIFLGLVFNVGFLLVTLHYQQKIHFMDFLLYLALVLITFIYDTIYGFQDINDDIKIGVKSSSIAVSGNPVIVLNVILTIVAIILVYIGYQNNFSDRYFILNFLFFVISFLLIMRCDYKKPQDCYELFQTFLMLEGVILIAFIIR